MSHIVTHVWIWTWTRVQWLCLRLITGRATCHTLSHTSGYGRGQECNDCVYGSLLVEPHVTHCVMSHMSHFAWFDPTKCESCAWENVTLSAVRCLFLYFISLPAPYLSCSLSSVQWLRDTRGWPKNEATLIDLYGFWHTSGAFCWV